MARVVTTAGAIAGAGVPVPVAAPSGGLLAAATATLWWREIVRFYRQPSRIAGALSSPLLFWIVIGSGLGGSFSTHAAGGATNFLEYFYPGIVALILLFTAIFSTVSVIQDRSEGFLQGVLVSPAPRLAIALGKILGSTTLALLQGGLFLLLAPFAGFHLGLAALGSILASMTLTAFALSGLGFLIAWGMESVQGFHVVMNLFLIPMWLLSGAFFPVEGASGWIGAIMRANPMFYAVDALHWSFYLDAAGAYVPQSGLTLPALFSVTLGFGAIMLSLATWIVSRRAR